MKKATKTLLCLLFTCAISYAQDFNQKITDFKTNTNAVVTVSKSFNNAEFIRFPFGERLIIQGNTARDKAVNFLNQYKSIYGVESIENSLRLKEVKTDNYGLKHVIFNQVHEGVPVFDGELRFHFDLSEKLSSVNGNILPNIQLNPIARLSSTEASNLALDIIGQQNLNLSNTPLYVHSNTLYVFPKGLVEGNVTSYHLAYEVEIRNDADVREFVYVDAHTGKLVEQFTGIAHAIDRVLYDENTSNTIWTEGDAFPGSLNQWEQGALVAAEHTYNFFNNTFGYVSYDGADAQMRTINDYDVFVNDPNGCPNASWNGVTTNYCPNIASDDVVAHEWGHAYTEYNSGLIYAWQSGALNESYSDIWGETIDIINGYNDAGEDLSLRTACSSSDRWRMGESAAALSTPIRDMWDPICNGHAGKVSDTQYWCSSGDSGGVHKNSGVPNHAYALLVDGGSYNGEIISAIGFTKAVHIFWRVQNVYLTPTSDFSDFADALESATADLMGIDLEGLSITSTAAGPSGEIINAGDLIQVQNAITAVELRLDPTACNFQPILSATDPLCDAANSNPLFSEDWESGLGSWTVEQIPTNPGTWESRDWVIETSLPSERSGSGVFGIDPVNGDCNTDLQNGIIRLQSPVITIPNISTGTFDMAFDHYIATEQNWDGGNIKYSLDGGAWTLLPNSAFTHNGYNGTINNPNDNPLAGEDAFTGSDEGSVSGSWGTSIIDLSSIGVVANSDIQFRWEMGTDGCNGRIGWYLDQLFIYNCSQPLAVAENNIIKENIKVFPNPTKDAFILKRLSNINLKAVRINDINGRLIKQINLSQMQNSKNIDISEVASGIYFMEVTSDLGKGTIKLVKE